MFENPALQFSFLFYTEVKPKQCLFSVFFFLGGKAPSLCSSGLLVWLLVFWYLKEFKVSLNHLAEVTQVDYRFLLLIQNQEVPVPLQMHFPRDLTPGHCGRPQGKPRVLPAEGGGKETCPWKSELAAPMAGRSYQSQAGAPTQHRAGAARVVGGLLLLPGFSSPEARC